MTQNKLLRRVLRVVSTEVHIWCLAISIYA